MPHLSGSCFSLALWHPWKLCIQYINRCNTSTTIHKMPLWQTHQDCTVLLTIVWLLLRPQCPAGSGLFLICVLAPLFQNERMCHPLSWLKINLEIQQISRDFMSDMKACQTISMSALLLFMLHRGSKYTQSWNNSLQDLLNIIYFVHSYWIMNVQYQ